MYESWGKDFQIANSEMYDREIVKYGENERQEIYLSLPSGKKDFPLIIWCHGGGLTGGSREFPPSLWNGEYAVSEVRYRLSDGEYTGLDCLSDAVSATAWIMTHITELGGDPSKIFIGGMSAGAYLAAMVGTAPHLLGKHALDYRRFAGLLIVSGQMTTHFQIKTDLKYSKSAYEPVIDEYAPLNYLSKDIAPALFVTGGFGEDIPGRAEENAFMAASLKIIGHHFIENYTLPGYDHCGILRGSAWLIERFIQRVLSKNTPK